MPRGRYPVCMTSTSDTPVATHGRGRILFVFAAIAVVALAAYRASVGFSFYDDTFYAVVPWRFAHGAKFLLDELSLQTVGEMVAVPLVWIWERIFGLTGIVLAMRLLWVALATAGAALAIRLLHGTARLGVLAAAVALPLLAPPYHVFAPTYNTVSSLLFTLAVLFGFAALRDRRATLAASAGVSLALGTAAYPPLAVAAIALLATFVVMAREWRLVGYAVGAAAIVGAAAGAALLLGVSLADVRLALSLGSANVSRFSSPADKLRSVFSHTGLALVSVWLLPMWALAAVASIPRTPARLRATALALLPLAAALPGAVLLASHDHLLFGTSAQSWLITLCAGMIVPSVVAAWRLGRRDLLRLLVLAAPFSAVGYVTVAYVTNSTWNRGMPAIALAPLAVGLLICWGLAIAEDGGWVPLVMGVLIAFAVVFGLLFASVFGQDPAQHHVRVTSGAYAGLLTTEAHRDQLRELSNITPRWVKPDSRVTFLGQSEAYLAVGGVAFTPAAWLFVGPADSVALGYFKREGHTPDVVFVGDEDVRLEGGYAAAPAHDPMLRWVLARYRRVDTAGGFSIFVRR
jgi:hypothetical protein